MNLQALMVSTDDAASELLGRVLPNFGIAVERFSDPETALARLQQQKFDALVLDFDDPELAHKVYEQARELGSGSSPLTIALVADPSKVPALAEPWFILFNATVKFRIVMTPDDLKRAGLDDLGKKWA